jgi:hypothetical protein
LRLKSLSALLVLLAATEYAAVNPSLSIGYRGEPGVESKMLATAQADILPLPYVKLDAGLSVNLFQNNGLGAAALGVGAVAYDSLGLTLRLAVQHQQWNGWQAGENRVLATLEAGSVYGFDAGLGLVQRVPVFGDKHWSPFVWSGGASEWNYLYRLRWKFIQRENWWLRAGFSSYDQYTAHNPQQFPLEADGAFRLKENLELFARAGTAIVGLSGGLVTLHEVELSAGVRYAL